MLKQFEPQVRDFVPTSGYVLKEGCTLESVRERAEQTSKRLVQVRAMARLVGLDLGKRHVCGEQIRRFAMGSVHQFQPLDLACVFRRQREVHALSDLGTKPAWYDVNARAMQIVRDYVEGLGSDIAAVARAILGPAVSAEHVIGSLSCY